MSNFINTLYRHALCDPKEWKKRSLYFVKANSPESKRYPGFNPRTVDTGEGVTIDYDVAFTLRDGVKMYVDIYRPTKPPGKVPIIIAWTPVCLLRSQLIVLWKTSSPADSSLPL